MAVPLYQDEAVHLPFREVKLSKSNRTLRIGRTSKRDSAFQAKKDNGWFESPVMSREHAKIQLNEQKQLLEIYDTGSLHGTFLNGRHLEARKPQTLANGDKITFGVTVERGMRSFPAYVLKVRAMFGTESRPGANPTVYRVPDDSDMEEIEGDDVQIRSALKIIDSVTTPTPAVLSSPEHIDLTAAKMPTDKLSSAYIDLTSMPAMEVLSQKSGPQGNQDDSPGSVLDSRVNPCYALESSICSMTGPQCDEDQPEDNQQDNRDLFTAPFGEDHMVNEFDCSGAIYDIYEEQDFEEQDDFESDMGDVVEDSFASENGDMDLDPDVSSDASLPNYQNDGTNANVDETWGYSIDDIPEASDVTTQAVIEEASDMTQALEDPASQLPPLVDYKVNDQSRVRLPSISTLTGTRPPTTDTLEKLITQSGKPEFFYAREENRALAQPLLGPFSSANHICNESQATVYTAMESPAPGLSQSDPIECNDGKLMVAPEVTMAESSEPPLAEAELLVGQEPESTASQLSSVPSQNKKRKAQEVSTSTEEEELKMGHNEEVAADLPCPSSSTLATKILTKASTFSLDHERTPVTKKLRRVAEFAGIAALGGVAVMSALIATAPAL